MKFLNESAPVNVVLLALCILMSFSWIYVKISCEKQIENILKAESLFYSRQLEYIFDDISDSASVLTSAAIFSSNEELKKTIDNIFSSDISILSVKVYSEKGLILNIDTSDQSIKRFEPGEVPVGPLMPESRVPVDDSYSASWVQYGRFDERAIIRLSLPESKEQGRFEVRIVIDLQFLEMKFPLGKTSNSTLLIVEDSGRVIHSANVEKNGSLLSISEMCMPSIEVCWPWQSRIISNESVSAYIPWSVIMVSSSSMWQIYAVILVLVLAVFSGVCFYNSIKCYRSKCRA